MASSPSFAATPKVGAATVSTADAGLATPSNPPNVLTAGTNGTRINAVIVQAMGTTAVGLVRLWLFDGTNYSLIREIPVFPVVPGTSIPAFQTVTTFDHLSIPSGWSLRASTTVAQSLRVIAMAADY